MLQHTPLPMFVEHRGTRYHNELYVKLFGQIEIK